MFKIKHNTQNKIIKYKTKWIVHEYKQQKNIDFIVIWTNVIKSAFFKLWFVLIAILDLHVHQLDIIMTFFYEFLQNVIYTIQSKGFIWDKFFVCFLKRAFYGLRQFFRVWYDLIRDFLQILKFKHNEFNHFVFIHFLWRIYICIYVNNFFIFFLTSII